MSWPDCQEPGADLEAGALHRPDCPHRATLDEAAAASNVSVRGLRQGGHLTLQQRYEEWMQTVDGQAVFISISIRAIELARAGWTHYGIATLWELARYDRSLQVGPSAGFKLNNDFRSRIARQLMEEFPTSLGGFFETRELKA